MGNLMSRPGANRDIVIVNAKFFSPVLRRIQQFIWHAAWLDQQVQERVPYVGQKFVSTPLPGEADGKEQLINAAVGRNAVKVGNTLEPCTTTVRSVRCSYRNEVWPGGPQVTFVDTPAL